MVVVLSLPDLDFVFVIVPSRFLYLNLTKVCLLFDIYIYPLNTGHSDDRKGALAGNDCNINLALDLPRIHGASMTDNIVSFRLTA
jgi:hypothetical protein